MSRVLPMLWISGLLSLALALAGCKTIKTTTTYYDTAVPELSYKNFHGDRDFVSLSIQRTF